MESETEKHKIINDSSDGKDETKIKRIEEFAFNYQLKDKSRYIRKNYLKVQISFLNRYRMNSKRFIQNIFGKRNNTIIIFLIISFLLINVTLTQTQYSYARLKVRGKGETQIYRENGICYPIAPMPDKVLINGINQNGEIKSFYNLTEDENNITLIFKSEISFLNSMFRYCFQINEIDLSQFDTIHVTDTRMMFEDCTKLTSLNLNNFITSEVTTMYSMFKGCSSLKYLDLSSFDRKNNLYMGFLFKGCSSLEFINVENLQLSTTNFDKIIEGTSLSLTICSKDNNWKSKLGLFDININCNNNNIYDNKCYKKSQNSYSKYICSICGQNYYEKEDVMRNTNSNINCYLEPEGYYLYTKDLFPYYKTCYQTCKKCLINGDKINNNCLECKENTDNKVSNNEYYNCYTKYEISTNVKEESTNLKIEESTIINGEQGESSYLEIFESTFIKKKPQIY